MSNYETSSVSLTASVSEGQYIPGAPDFDSSVTWSIVSGSGKLTNPTASSVTYTAPSVSTKTDVELKATSNWDVTKSSTITIAVYPVAVELGKIYVSMSGFTGDYVPIFSGGTPPENVFRENVKVGETVTFYVRSIIAGTSGYPGGAIPAGSGVSWEIPGGIDVVALSPLKLKILNTVGQVITLTARSISNPDKFVQVLLTITP